MTARRILLFEAMPARDANGRALPSKLYFYAPGTMTPKAVYTSSALTTLHAFPVVSDSNGQFADIWADDQQAFDVGWADTATGGTQRFYENVSPLADALSASAQAAEAARDAASASAAAAATNASEAMTAETAAETAQTAAEEAQAAAEAAAATAVQIAGFDPALYQLRSEEGQANGYAPLNGSGKVPDTHLTTAPVSTAQQAAIDAAAVTSAGLAAALAIAL